MKIHTVLINSILAKTLGGHTDQRSVSYLLTFEELYMQLNQEEVAYCKLLISQNPTDYAITEPFIGIESVPANVVAVEGQEFAHNGVNEIVKTQYVPTKVYQAYAKLTQAYHAVSGKKLLIGSGYRSPANQTINFFYWLKYYEYDFIKTLGFVSIPGYSEHSSATHTALDFMTEEGIFLFDSPPFARFDETPEYAWLLKNAQAYGFVLSAPKNNQHNVQFEPWHWRYDGDRNL